jgi:hypothetical protein
MFNNLSFGPSLGNIRSIDDRVDAQATGSYGIVIQGDVVAGEVTHAIVSNTSTGQAISIRPERYRLVNAMSDCTKHALRSYRLPK